MYSHIKDVLITDSAQIRFCKFIVCLRNTIRNVKVFISTLLNLTKKIRLKVSERVKIGGR